MQPYTHFITDIPSYSLLAFIGLMFAIVICVVREKKYGYNDRILLIIMCFTLIGMALGSKLLFFITQMPYVLEDFSIKKLLDTFITSGFVFYGGLLGAYAFAYLGARVVKVEPKQMLSYLTPSFVIFHAFGRIGCFLGGCCYGIPWEYGIAMAESPDIKRFPIQLFEAGIELLIFFMLLRIEKKGTYNLAVIYLLTYSIIRFLDEFLRDDGIRGIWLLGLSTSQYISLIIFVSVIVYLIIHKERKKECTESK